MPTARHPRTWLLALLAATALVVAGVAAAAVSGPAAAGAGPAAAGGSTVAAVGTAANGTPTPGGPGAAVAGVTGEHGARVDGAVRRAAFRRDLDAADSADARAEVVATYLDASATRLDALERRQDVLETGLANGSLSRGAYDARARTVWAATRSLQRLLADVAAAADRIPDGALRSAGVEEGDVAAVERDARELTSRSEPEDAGDSVGPGVYADVERLVAGYNRSVAGETGVSGRLAGEVVEFEVEDGGATAVASVRVDGDGRFTQLRAGRRGDVTVRLVTDRETLAKLAAADDTAGALRRAVANDEVTIHGVGPVNAIKWLVVDVLDDL